MRFIDLKIKVLLFTGIVVDWEELNVNGIIQKPYSSGEILEKMRELPG